LIPYLLFSPNMENLRVFFRFLLTPSQSSGDSFVVEDEDQPFSTFYSLVLGWIGQDYDDASLHEFVRLAHLHELDFMIGYDIVSVSTHDHFVLDLSLLWFKHKGRHFDKMLGWLCWLYDYMLPPMPRGN
jgi:hypothetical protein